MRPEDLRARLVSLERAGDYQGAYQLLQEALGRYPTQPFFLKNEVYLLLRLKRFVEAREKAEAVFHTLQKDLFFLRTYLSVLNALNLREEIERLLALIATWEIRDENFLRYISGLKRKRTVPSAAPAASPAEAQGLRQYRDRFAGRSVAEAIAEIETILVLPEYERDGDLRLCLAELHKKAGRFDRAAAVYEKLLQQRENGFVRKLLGFALKRAGDLGAAQGQLRLAFLEDPTDHFITAALGKLYREQDDAEGWKNLLNEALARHPEAVRLHGLIKRAQSCRSV